MVKRIKRANGKGSIEKRPNGTYRIRVWSYENGKRKRKTLTSGLKTYKEAERKLNDYIIQPYELNSETLLFKDLYKKFIQVKHQENVSEATIKNIGYAFNRCIPLHNLRIKDITKAQIKLFINTLMTKQGTPATNGTKENTKIFLYSFFQFAIDNNLLKNNVAKFRMKKAPIEKENQRQGIIFTSEEIKKLWENVSIYDWIDVILIMIYTGYRIGEITNIKKADVDFNNWIITGGNKTGKGKNKKIPIKENIKDLILNRYNDSTTDYLIDHRNWKIKAEKRDGKPIRENYLREQFYKIMDLLGMSHKPHDTRKTFATMLSNVGASETVITDLVGHTDIKTTNEYYIKNDIETLKQAIDKLN